VVTRDYCVDFFCGKDPNLFMFTRSTRGNLNITVWNLELTIAIFPYKCDPEDTHFWRRSLLWKLVARVWHWNFWTRGWTTPLMDH
jgi:hypothetical protein